MPDATEDEEYNVCKMRSAMPRSLNQLFTHIRGIHSLTRDRHTKEEEDKKIEFHFIGSCYLFLIEIVLENVRFICRGIIGLFYEVLRVNRCK